MSVSRPKIAAAFVLLAMTSTGTGGSFAPALAKSHFSQATTDPADENIKQGLKLLRDGEYDGAIDSFKQAAYFSRNQYNPDAYKYLGLCYKATRNYAKAIETFKIFFTQTTNTSPDVRIDLAECYINVQEWDKARDELMRCAAEDAGNKNRWRQQYAMGELHEKLAASGAKNHNASSELSQALEFYNLAIEEKHNYTEAWMSKSKVELELGNTNQALKDYREILSRGPLMHPNLEELYYNMGTCLAKHGDDQGALDHFHLAVESNPDSYDAHLAIGSLLDQERHYSSALKEYELAVRCSAKDNPAQAQILRRIEWLEQKVEPKEAPISIKPSPNMRQQDEDSLGPASTFNNEMPARDAGF